MKVKITTKYIGGDYLSELSYSSLKTAMPRIIDTYNPQKGIRHALIEFTVGVGEKKYVLEHMPLIRDYNWRDIQVMLEMLADIENASLAV